ncbi:MAG TPA: hypothetical protein VFH23_00755 [Jiangellaceae bacterium]|nr:hypothetical protein [Jiangellaceae bacterium]
MTTTTEQPTGMTRRDVQLIKRGLDIINTGELRRVREALQLSRPRMARLLGVNEFTLRSWELDKRLPDEPAVLIKIVEGVEKFRKVIDDTS